MMGVTTSKSKKELKSEARRFRKTTRLERPDSCAGDVVEVMTCDEKDSSNELNEVALPSLPDKETGSDTDLTKCSSRDLECHEIEGNINEAHNNFTTGSTSRRKPTESHDPYAIGSNSGIVKVSRGLPTPGLPGSSFASQFIKVSRLRIAIDKRLTIIDERSPAVLKYRTPHFRALATVDIPPLQNGENFQIGWIQVCTDMHFINLYGNEGLTSWEFPEIVSGKYKMISDADGKQYPWYGSKDEVKTLRGPSESPNQITVHMNDNFFPQVTWYIPHSDYVRQPKLTHIYRNQHFYAFLALRDLSTHKFRVLRAVAWSMELAIEVNPTLALGRRAKLLGPYEQVQPRVIDDNTASRLLESYALNPPNANNAQVLVWRPRVGFPKVIVPPVQTTVDITQYLVATESYTRVLEQLACKVFGNNR